MKKMKKVILLLTVLTLLNCASDSLKIAEVQKILETEFPKYSNPKYVYKKYSTRDNRRTSNEMIKLKNAGLVNIIETNIYHIKALSLNTKSPAIKSNKKSSFEVFQIKHILGKIIGISNTSENKAEVIFEEILQPTEFTKAANWNVKLETIKRKANFTKYDSGWKLDKIIK